MTDLDDPRLVPDQVDLERMRLDLEASLLGTPARSLGRFSSLGRLGEGGMGVVYRARDPRLQRDVAIKLTGIRAGSSGEARLEQEARLLGRLNHPNVLAVHELGEQDGDLFVVMELVEGETLARWNERRASRTGDDIRAAIEFAGQAASGLSAAHEAGLLHRDVKPSNLLIDRSGRLRVADFGLAVHENAQSSDATSESSNLSDERMTGTGVNVGTPAYMAPEQHRGSATRATDQFAWAMTFFEALYGERPYSPSTLAQAAQELPRLPRPRGSVSRDHHAVLERALAWSPEDRFPSMDAVRSAWENAGRPKRHWVPVLGLVSVAAIAWSVVAPPGADPCDTAGDEVYQHWNDGIRDRMSAHFVRVDSVLGERTAARIVDDFDDWAQSLSEEQVRACTARATPAHQERAQSLCFARRYTELDAAVDTLLESAEKSQLQRADRVAAGHPSPSRCNDAAFLANAVEPPEAGEAADVERVGAIVARSAALVRVGSYDAALELADEAKTEALAQTYAPLRARAHLQLANVLSKQRQNVEAIDAGRTAFAVAQAAGDPVGTYEAAYFLARKHVQRRVIDQADDALWMQEVARGLLPRLDSAHREHRLTQLDTVRGEAILLEGHTEEALEVLTAAVEQLASLRADTPELARAYTSLAYAHARAGDLEGEGRAHGIAREVFERTLGPHHPETSNAYINIANNTLRLQNVDEAIRWYERALEVRTNALDPDDTRIGDVWLGLGSAYRRKRDPQTALTMLDRAEAIYRSSGDEQHTKLAQALMSRGNTLSDLGRIEEGLASLHRALEIFKSTQAPGSRDIVGVLTNIAITAEERIPDAELQHILEEALDAHRSSGRGPDPLRVRLASMEARVHLRADRAMLAVASLESVLKATEAKKIPTRTRADANWVFGQALAAAGDVERARTYVAAAVRPLAENGAPNASKAAQAWLDAHPAGGDATREKSAER